MTGDPRFLIVDAHTAGLLKPMLDHRYTQNISIVLAVILACCAVVLNHWLLARLFSADGYIKDWLSLAAIWTFQAGCIITAVLLIALRKSPRVLLVYKSLLCVTAMVATTLLVDNGLYALAPSLPRAFRSRLSVWAQMRITRSLPDDVPWVYSANIRYGKPGAQIHPGHVCDEFGYRNPCGYLTARNTIDILLCGDSFVFGTEAVTIADYLRKALRPYSVYSVGIPADGMGQWRYHYGRFVERSAAPPQIVVLNYYSGNDLTDTRWFAQIEQAAIPVDSVLYGAHLHSLPRVPRWFALAEIRSLLQTSNVANALTEWPEVRVRGLPEPYYIVAREGEPEPPWNDSVIERQLRRTVEDIRRARHDTRIVFSYIACWDALYGERTVNFSERSRAIQRQVTSASILRSLSARLNIQFVDVTPSLRKAAATSVSLWNGTHFSAVGYELYAQYLSAHLATLLTQRFHSLP